MKKLLSNTSVLFASSVLFAAGVLWQSNSHKNLTAPTSLSVILDDTLASGPTIPPGPWDDDDNGGDTKIASGPTIPPGPWDDDDNGGDTKAV